MATQSLVRVKNAAGQLHCDTGPALYSMDGVTKRWFRNGALHREDGPAVQYDNAPEDNLWFLEGVAVNQKIVMTPEKLTPEEIMNEDNLEVRRVMINRVGVENLLEKTDAKVLYEGDNDIEGTAESIFEIVGSRFFCGKCPSTGRIYFMEIPNTIKNGKEARKYLSNLDPDKCIGAS